MKTSKPLAIFLSIITALAVVSGSIAVPLLCRPFYYAHIGPMGLAEYTGLSTGAIEQAYDEMMDFCIGLSDEFSTGVLPWSQSGKEHFVDVKSLFQLDLIVLALSLLALIAIAIYCRKMNVRPHLFRGHGSGFWAATGLGVTFLGVGALAATNFQRAFVIFHTLFFPGKDNWMFDWQTDAIILILPEAFFRNCAILILALLLLWCGVLIAADLWAVKKRKH